MAINQKLLFAGLIIALVWSICMISTVKTDEEQQPSAAPAEDGQSPDKATKVDQDDDDDDDDDDDVDAPAVPEGMNRENMVKWSAPDLSDEEAHSTRLPSNMKCDGCTAVAYQLSLLLNAVHEAKYKKRGKRAPESEIIELVEKICEKNTFEGYGLKSMNGVNRLSGPGTEAVDEPGMMQGGGRWPFRLHQMCGEIVGEADEYEIYNVIADQGPDKLFSFLCEDPENDALNSCGKIKRKDEL